MERRRKGGREKERGSGGKRSDIWAIFSWTPMQISSGSLAVGKPTVRTVTVPVTYCEAAVVTEFSDTVRVWTTLPAPGRRALQLSQAEHQRHALSIVTCICRNSEGFLINGGDPN